jgi:hypothetical protein
MGALVILALALAGSVYLYRIFSYVALGRILLAVSYLYQKYRTVILGPSPEERT